MKEYIFKFICLMLGLQLPLSSYSQTHFDKKLIDSSAYRKWKEVDAGVISGDGKFAAYTESTMFNEETSSFNTVLKSTQGTWKFEIRTGFHGVQVEFTDDSKFAYILNNDTLVIVRLGTQKIEYLSNIKTYNTKGRWLIYQSKDDSCFVFDFHSGISRCLDKQIEGFVFNNIGFVILNKRSLNGKGFELIKIDLTKNIHSTIYKSPVNKQFIAAKSGGVFAFNSEEDSVINICDLVKGERKIIISQIKQSFPSSRIILEGFSDDEQFFFFKIKSKNEQRPFTKQSAVKVEVWSYRDTVLKSAKPNNGVKLEPFKSYFVNLKSGKIVQLGNEQDELLIKGNRFAVLLNSNNADDTEIEWNPLTNKRLFLLSLENAKKTEIIIPGPYKRNDIYLSPNEKFLVYYDNTLRRFVSFDTRNENTRILLNSVPTDWRMFGIDLPHSNRYHYPIAGWVEPNRVLLSDQNDLWEVDLSNSVAPINLTDGFGKTHNIRFVLFNSEKKDALNNSQPMILYAFNRENKQNGFYDIRLGRSQTPKKLFMGNYLFFHDDPGEVTGFKIVRAEKASAYLVKRCSAEESSNYFYSKDLKRFKAISNISPERQYNWLTTQIINFQGNDGSRISGILYKPENFDPDKIYPLIFNIYEKKSNNLNVFLKPNFSTGSLDIPTYVSNGYLIFTPDINYHIGSTGENALMTIKSSIAYLSKLPYIDTKRLGLQGHSFGGYEVNYIVTHCKEIAAACAASGMSDFISLRGLRGAAGDMMAEHGQNRLGKTLWSDPLTYIVNSPVIYADRIKTPLLMLNNIKDNAVPFSQGLEFFTALRKLGKKVWMLQYNASGHTVEGDDAKDFTIRMQQFFDHYLKGKPAPKWMTIGIPASMKGMDDGLELDEEIKTPGPGLVTDTIKTN